MKENNNNELENLYKKAAAHFPLNTNSANWQIVLNQLEHDDTKKAFWFNKKNIFLALLLLIFSVISIGIVSKIFNKTFSNANRNVAEKNKLAAEKKQAKILEEKITQIVYQRIMDSLNKANIIENKKHLLIKKSPLLNNENIVASITNKAFIEKNKNIKNDIIKNIYSSNQNQKEKDLYTIPIYLKRSVAKINQADTIEEKPMLETTKIVAHTSDSVTTKILAKTDHSINKTIIPLPINKSKNDKYFYAGILYAHEISSLHFEKHKADDMGYSLSFLIGYRFNKYLSLESGIAFQSKEYYTLGDHFNKSILPTNGNVLWIEAENKLIEIPVSLKLDFLNKMQHHLFTNIGISSYIVNNEVYEYEQETAGVITKESVEYKATSSNLFAMLNFGLGYQYSFKKWGSIRLQPYLNIPLNGIGKGNAPIVSKGIYAGWIYNFKH